MSPCPPVWAAGRAGRMAWCGALGALPSFPCSSAGAGRHGAVLPIHSHTTVLSQCFSCNPSHHLFLLKCHQKLWLVGHGLDSCPALPIPEGQLLRLCPGNTHHGPHRHTCPLPSTPLIIYHPWSNIHTHFPLLPPSILEVTRCYSLLFSHGKVR